MSDIKFPKFYPETKQTEGEEYEPTCKVEVKENCFLLRLITAENQFSYKSMTAIMEALTDIEKYYWHERENTKCVRYLVTIGEGKKYSNGLDIGCAIETRPKKFLTLFHNMLIKLLKFPMPTIAALNGHCFAGGAIFAITHDFRVMRTEKGFFCMNEVELNMPMLPALNVLFRFKFRDYSVFQKVLLKGHKFKAEEALADGLVDAIAPIDKLLEKAIELGDLYGSKLEIGGDIYSVLRADYLKEIIKALEKDDIGEYYSKL